MKVVCFDLDDTLFKEINYLKSAYKEIASHAVGYCRGINDSSYTLTIRAYEDMLFAYEHGDNAFERLNYYLGLSIPIKEYIDIYHNHIPEISLSEETESVLFNLKKSDYKLGLITDGRLIQQRSKINALKIDRFFNKEDIIISEAYGSEKPALRNYQYFMDKYQNCKYFTYIGDNINKDFLAPNALGWNSICLLNNGQNIHKQDFTLAKKYLPKFHIKSLNELFLYV